MTALAVARAGSRVASADWQGHLFLRDLRSGEVVSLAPGATVLSLAFTPDGQRLAVGPARVGSKAAQMQVWDAESQRPIRRLPTADHVHACAISRDGAKLAYVGGKSYEVFVDSPSGVDRPKILGGTSRRVLKVAFAKNPPFYRVAFGGELLR